MILFHKAAEWSCSTRQQNDPVPQGGRMILFHKAAEWSCFTRRQNDPVPQSSKHSLNFI
jgi:hypothetical protein